MFLHLSDAFIQSDLLFDIFVSTCVPFLWYFIFLGGAGAWLSERRSELSYLFSLLEAAFRIPLAQTSEGARAPHFEWA